MSEADALAELERETRSSITFKRSAKQEPYWDIKCYFESGSDHAAYEAIERVDAIDRDLRARFLGEPVKKLPY